MKESVRCPLLLLLLLLSLYCRLAESAHGHVGADLYAVCMEGEWEGGTVDITVAMTAVVSSSESALSLASSSVSAASSSERGGRAGKCVCEL